MNRQMLREQTREETKMQKWFDNWTPQQMRFHKELIRKIVQDSQEKTELIIDSCYIGAILEHTGIELKDCIEIAKLANLNMEETSKYLNREKEYYKMVNDEKLRSQIREEAKKLQKEGMKIAPGIKELRKTYNFPQKDIHIIWAEGREELKADEELKTVIEKHLPKEELPYSVTEKEIEEAQKGIDYSTQESISRKITITPTGITTNGAFKESKLKIIEQTLKVQGEYGTYIKTTEGIKTDKIFVKDIKDLEEYKKSVQDIYDKGRENLNKRFKELQEEKQQLIKRADKNFAIIDEINQVFSM